MPRVPLHQELLAHGMMKSAQLLTLMDTSDWHLCASEVEMRGRVGLRLTVGGEGEGEGEGVGGGEGKGEGEDIG